MTGQEQLHHMLASVREATRLREQIVEPDDSYWFHRPARNFPPKSIRDMADYDGGERLALWITQTDLPAGRQKAQVREWCELLPTLGNVRVLWFHSRVSQAMFEAACAMPGLEGLYVKWSSIESLAPLSSLTGLSHFHLGGAPSAHHLDVLARLPKLVDLEICKVRAAGNLDFLADLTGLRALLVAGDTNSLQAQITRSLAPLANLRELERLSLIALQLQDESLAPLADLPKLKYLALSNRFPMEEFARLAGRRPEIKCDRFAASWPMNLHCRKCRQASMHILTGKGTPFLCSRCDASRLQKHAQAFEAIRIAERIRPDPPTGKAP